MELQGLSILVVEDELLLRKQLAAYLEHQGADVSGVGNLAAARQMAAQLTHDFVLLDVNLPDGLGTDLLKEKLFSANTAVVVMTANGGVDGAVEAMRLGAADYLVKPFDPAELPLVFRRVRRSRQAARIEEKRREDLGVESLYFGPSLAALESQMNKILAADRRMQTRLSPVLIMGETGTGKTSFARWLHQHGPRAGQPLVEVNCSALPETLAESELFGHERGAFTDARAARMGLFEAANGGTLFLDELPSLSPALQAKVLTAIEDHQIRRVGGNKMLPIDVRLIAATNRDLKKAVAEGQFREDLFHRLDLFRLVIPPLRERGSDIVTLAELLIARICRKHRLPPKKLSPQGRQRLSAYQWPGNVRELAHELERGIVFEEDQELHLGHLSLDTVGSGIRQTDSLPIGSDDWLNPNFQFPPTGFNLEEAILRLIQRALKQSEGNISAAARLLGVSRDYLRYRLEAVKNRPENGA